jgi:hypothetical protein
MQVKISKKLFEKRRKQHIKAHTQVKHVRLETAGSERFPVKSSGRTKTPVPLSVSGFFPANSGARK